MSPAAQDDLVRVARIGKPHGIRGEVTVQVFTDDPDARFAPGERLVVRDGAPGLPAELTVTRARWNKQILVVGFAESPDRNVAETLRGAQLFAVPAAPEESDEWYEEDLVDLEVRVEGERVGVVTALTTGAVQDLLHVALDGVEEEALVPFVEEIVPEIDSEAGVLVLTPPPGLLELATGEDEDAADGPAAASPADADPED
ncbi:ribosome maturation factor RimM [Micrococcus luteus]|nr:ribosome maturation factor RimM [Micrococcus luteus]